ncbi:MAG: sulfite exporter TauE/SafE family protein [bacterium]|nr:sulfite exporter TauE/SafE family protein [bacterium]
MEKQKENLILRVKGMTCVNCEYHIEEDIKQEEGIEHVKASFKKETVTIGYDPLKICEDKIIKVIEASGYTAEHYTEEAVDQYKQLNKLLFGILIILVGAMFLRRTGLAAIFNFFPQADENTSYIMLIVIGFLTSFHCIAMCGGISLSQCMEGESTIRPSMLYNLGRVISYTVVGGIVGGIGSVISFSGPMQGAVQLFAGIFMVVMGINMLGIAPRLRKFNLRMPKQFATLVNGKKDSNSPFIVGIMNGLMPCGPLQSMQLYALSVGSMFHGALAMFLFSIGTVPLMFLLGVVSSLLSKRSAGRIVRFGAVLVIILGISMFNNGLGLAGVSTSYKTTGEIVKAEEKNGVQEVTIALQSGSYTPIVVEKGTKVRWTINAAEGTINGCNNKIIVREYGIEQKLNFGENVIEFTPTETGSFVYSCWMGMIRSKIIVVEPGEEADIDEEVNEYQIGGRGQRQMRRY